jgi:hypothetical protein
MKLFLLPISIAVLGVGWWIWSVDGTRIASQEGVPLEFGRLLAPSSAPSVVRDQLPALPSEPSEALGGSPVTERRVLVDDLVAMATPRPEPGEYEQPLIKETYGDNRPCFEAEQVQDEDGIWRLHGNWLSWYENGQLQERGQYENQLETGRWEWWHDNGFRAAFGQFEAGKRIGAWSLYYENGVKMADASYAEGAGQGPWILYYDDGSRWAQGNYIDGEIAGYWTIWDEFGEVNPERSGVYEAGARVSP